MEAYIERKLSIMNESAPELQQPAQTAQVLPDMVQSRVHSVSTVETRPLCDENEDTDMKGAKLGCARSLEACSPA